jgi:diguanylate cyclase (GGDEF)-like protein
MAPVISGFSLMRRLTVTLACLFGFVPASWSAPPEPLTTLRAISTITNEQAAQRLPVTFEGTITYYARSLKNLNVQDGDRAIFVKTTKITALLPGDRILVQGTMQPSFRPYVLAESIIVLRHGPLPAPRPASFDDLTSGELNCMYVSVRGVVRSADIVSSVMTPTGHLRLLMEGGYIDLEVDSHDQSTLNDLLDAEVEVIGAAGRIFDGKMQQIGAKVKVTTIKDIKVIRHASVSPWSLPVTPMDRIVTGLHVRDLTQRMRVHGAITYYQPGVVVVLQSGSKSLWVSTRTSEPLQIGDLADATGFPETHNGLLTLNYAEVQDSHIQAPVTPQSGTWRQLAFWGRSILGGHQDDLVSIEGRVLTEVREAEQDEYVLTAEGRIFTAIYHHPPEPKPVPPMLQVPLGSTIRVTGICMALDANPYKDEAPFNILLRSFDDIVVVASPSPLNIRNLILLVCALLLIVFAVLARSWALERKVRQKTSALASRIEVEAALQRRSAQLEQQRSRILEDINGSRPLAEILEEITKLVSFKLEDALCWCKVTDGALLGDRPPKANNLHIVRVEIPARSGPPLGALFAAFDPAKQPDTKQASAQAKEALAVGVRIATLAIETRRLYSDLRRRSEFDLLTDIHNRFSLDKHLDLLIEEARQNAAVFGLVYIDLDKFKQINDRYGHHVGDLYLQEAAQRMKHQMRGGDILARLGGDEFAALVSVVRDRAGVEEIALRMDRCFEMPFTIEGNIIHGGASVGFALYPEDGASRDAILSAADAAMYVVKNNRRQIEQSLGSVI